MKILIVRLGALGDIIHALPAASALREAFASAQIDWLVSARHQAILEHVGPMPDGRALVDDVVVVKAGKRGVAQAIAQLRKAGYDIAFDFQGLMKSAVFARSSGAARVVGFATPHLRERWAGLFYTESVEPVASAHVIDKNLSLLAAVGLRDLPKNMPPLVDGAGAAGGAGKARGVILNPGAGWPNKRWPPEWFAEIAHRLHTRHEMRSIVLWGPGEEHLARLIAASSRGAAEVAPPTDIGEMIALVRDAALFISGDTGPLHIAAALGTPIVGIYGPTNPARNGPWDPADICVSRFDACKCHYRRRCRLDSCCLLDITVDEVMAAVERRLGVVASHG